MGPRGTDSHIAMASHVLSCNLPREVGVITLSLHRRKPRLRERKKLA